VIYSPANTLLHTANTLLHTANTLLHTANTLLHTANTHACRACSMVDPFLLHTCHCMFGSRRENRRICAFQLEHAQEPTTPAPPGFPHTGFLARAGLVPSTAFSTIN